MAEQKGTSDSKSFTDKNKQDSGTASTGAGNTSTTAGNPSASAGNLSTSSTGNTFPAASSQAGSPGSTSSATSGSGMSGTPSSTSASPGRPFKESTPATSQGSMTTGGISSGAATAPAKTLIDQAKATAGKAYEAVSEKAVSTLDDKKATLTDGLTSVAQTFRQAGDNLTGTSSENGLTDAAAKYTATAAQKIEDAAQYFEQNDIKGMMRDVEGFARRNPAIFLGAAFAAGVLIARFLKAEPSSYQNTGGSFNASKSGGKFNTGTSGSTQFGGTKSSDDRMGGVTDFPGGEFVK